MVVFPQTPWTQLKNIMLSYFLKCDKGKRNGTVKPQTQVLCALFQLLPHVLGELFETKLKCSLHFFPPIEWAFQWHTYIVMQGNSSQMRGWIEGRGWNLFQFEHPCASSAFQQKVRFCDRGDGTVCGFRSALYDYSTYYHLAYIYTVWKTQCDTCVINTQTSMKWH